MLKCVLSEKPSTDLTLNKLSAAGPRVRLNSGFRVLGILCCPGCQSHTRMCIHTAFPSSCAPVGAHQPKQGYQMVWVAWHQQQGALISLVIGVFLWHPQSSAVCAISSWMCWLIPQKEKVQAGAKHCKHRCGHTWLQCLGPAPSSPCCAT